MGPPRQFVTVNAAPERFIIFTHAHPTNRGEEHRFEYATLSIARASVLLSLRASFVSVLALEPAVPAFRSVFPLRRLLSHSKN